MVSFVGAHYFYLQIQIEFTKAAKQYGDVFMLCLPGERTVVISSASIARDAVLTKKDDFSGRPYKFTWDYLTRGSRDIAIGDFSPSLILQRKIVHSAMRSYMSRLESTVIREVDELTKRLRSHHSKPMDPGHDFFLTTLNVICAIVYGQRYEIDDPEFLRIVDYNEKMFRLLAAVNLLNTLPFLAKLPIKDSRDLEYVRITRDELLDRKLNEHRETYEEGNIRDLTDALIKALEEAKKEDSKVKDLITQDHVVLTMADAFSGGLETTTSTLRWFFVYMMSNPEVQARVHAELDDVIGRDVMPRWEDKDRLPYLEAVIAETLRLSSVVALAVPHKTIQDTTLEGYDIPKGTTVLLNIWAMHHNETEWTCPLKFDPSRFLDSDGNFSAGSGSRSYLPFGAGRRVCIGEALAKQELFVVISRLMHKFVNETAESPLPPFVGSMGLVHVAEPYEVCFKERLRSL
ncbi:predicted protein [Nematostella vectensis]|uniref:Steroid 21-hydroxylase n=1 Tax=Nematostella vectensis TaxID=45351 RepID=A7RN35_NEMVE|nr:predicted protein [Nematostella vectensis]|eukprot:XP_001639062.1 predicted protein [Nematostella vectensis]